MTDQHHTFELYLTDPALLRLPDADSPVVYLTALMAISNGDQVLYEWTEQDVMSALYDFAHKTSVCLGQHAHLDLFYFGNSRVQLLLWTDGHAQPPHAIVVSESDFFWELDRISAAANVWAP